ncbi:hypothetical protein AMAG_13143 [Allomyces macrogynus ATCC 38327]|uniref:Uncharacterized protein n=1 Tax=Allomyces macrogynus (strain ATCC 38327) TaxID=578462 RepID=A0A0L0SZM1_ALLM3|nr:hypothetical protein AMAG_13143 [Allomyces macrogynus ATCC 38327]|eukprot:KNE67963.1 hypothetical protein AMAG_13143 [Allomyces macrogynus ATCC 38327]
MPPSTPFVLPPTPPHAGGTGPAFNDDVDDTHHGDRAALYPLETTASPRRGGPDARIKLAGSARTSARWSPAAHAAARLRRRAVGSGSSPTLVDVDEMDDYDEGNLDVDTDTAWRSAAPLAHPAPMHSPPLSPDMVIATPRRGALVDLPAHRNDARRSASASPPGKENAHSAPAPAPTTPPWLLAWNMAKRARQSPSAAVREVDSAHVTDVDEDEDDSALLDVDDFEEGEEEDEGGSEESDDIGPIVFPQRHKLPFGTTRPTPVPELFAHLADDFGVLSETDDDDDGHSGIDCVDVHGTDSDDDEIVFLNSSATRRHAEDAVPPRHQNHALPVPMPALPLAVRPRSVLHNKLANAWDHAAAPIRRRLRGRHAWVVATTAIVLVLVSACASWLVVGPQGAVVIPQGSVSDLLADPLTPTSAPALANDDPAASRILAEQADLCARTALGTLRPAAPNPTPICDSPLPILAAPFARAFLLAHAVHAYLLSASTVHDTTPMSAALDTLIWTRAADGIGSTVATHARLASAMDRLVRAMITAHARAEVVVDDELRGALRAVVRRIERATHGGVASIEAVHLNAHVDRVARDWGDALDVVVQRAEAVVKVAEEVGSVEVALDQAVKRVKRAVGEFRDRVVTARRAMLDVVDRRGGVRGVEEVLGGPVSTVKEVHDAVGRIEVVITQAREMVRGAEGKAPAERDGVARVTDAFAP